MNIILPGLLLLALTLGGVSPATAQRARFQEIDPTGTFAPATTMDPFAPSSGGIPEVLPQNPAATFPTPTYPNPGVPGNTGIPEITPGFSNVNPTPVFPDPRSTVTPPPFSIQPGTQFNPQSSYGVPPAYPSQPGYPNTTPPFQGTGSTWLPPSEWTWPQQLWTDFQDDFLPRLFERPRARQTWITGDSDNQLGMNELELATTVNFPNFFGSGQPLRVSPGYIFHWLDGPDSTKSPGFDLPPRVYSAYLAFDHMTNPSNRFGLENNLTIGVNSDFDHSSSDSLRLTGRLVGWTRINPYTVGKLGVEYFDRVDIKLLPAFGVYMSPNSDIRWDLFFPRTKLAHRMPNLGNYEVWSYLGAEIGGGSWSLDRTAGFVDQADINDVRSFIGLEWMGPRRVTGFLEVGYVFNREIVYRSNPGNSLELEDAFMLRSGVAF